ncbi:hypothetical protein BN1708_019489, partial [Verticillium longisporum]
SPVRRLPARSHLRRRPRQVLCRKPQRHVRHDHARDPAHQHPVQDGPRQGPGPQEGPQAVPDARHDAARG